MRKTVKRMLLVGLLLLLGSIVAVTGLTFYLFSPAQGKDHPQDFPEMASPSGRYTLRQVPVEDAYDVAGYTFSITEAEGAVETTYLADEYFRKRDRFYLNWDESHDIVWVYSGGKGCFCWIYQEGEWDKHTFAEAQTMSLTPPKQWELPAVYQDSYEPN